MVEVNWVKEIKGGAKRWESFDVFGGKILPVWPQGRDHEWTKLINDNFYATAFAVADWKIPEGPYQAGKVWGPNMVIRRKVFERGFRFNTQVGPKGRTYVMGSETEFTKRLEYNGHKAVYLPKSLVYHQIREEQLNEKWIYQRAFNHGRSDAYYERHAKVPELWDIPRYLYRQLFELNLKQLVYLVKRKRADYLNTGIDKWFIRGKMFQFMENKKSGAYDIKKVK